MHEYRRRLNGSMCRRYQKVISALAALLSRAVPLRSGQTWWRDPGEPCPILSRNSGDSKRRRVHQQHRDDTSKKDEQHNSKPDKNAGAHRIVLLLLATKGRRAAQMWQLRARFGKVSLDFLRLGQRL